MNLPVGAPPENYVARDRARRFAFLLAQAAQERRLAYQGERIGMTSLKNEALVLLATLVKEAEASVADVLAFRLRDRERGYMDIPFVVLTEGLLERARLALRLERGLAARSITEAAAQPAVLDLLDDSLRRIDGFCATYDEKRPLPAPRTVDLARLLTRVERDAVLERTLRPAPTPLSAYDGPPPELLSAADALDDLLRAARAALPLDPGPWRVQRGRGGEPLRLSLGALGAEADELPPPPRLERAVRVLQHLHPVSVSLRGRAAPAGPAPTGPALPRRTWGAGPGAPADTPPPPPPAPTPTWLERRLPDPAAGGTELSSLSGAGHEARLSPAAEKAVRALLAAPAMPEQGAPPPQRTIALLGLLRAFDGELVRVLPPRLAQRDLWAAARELPREDSRKAQVRHDVRASLEAAFPGLPLSRLEDLVSDVASGKAGRKRATTLDAALLLALFARPYVVGGFKAVPALGVAPWAEADVGAAVAELLEVFAVRKALDAGQAVEAAAMGRMERALVALLGRLGRLA